jgi:hypothetical protein
MLRTALSTAVALLLLAGAVHANFVEVEVGARAMGMGGAFVAVADDATTLHWNPAGLSGLHGFQVFGMRTSVYSVDGLSEDAVLASYGTGTQGFGLGWMRTGAKDLYDENLYSENTIMVGYGRRTPVDGLSLGASVKRLSNVAPRYEYYNDPAYDEDGDSGYTGDIGALYWKGNWRAGAVFRNIGEPELQVLSTTEDPDPVVSELRIGGSYLFREVMLMTVELRAPREVPEYFEDSYTINLGTEVWFYEAFALRAGMNRDRITAGLGLRTKHVQVDVALLSERRIGSLYRLSTVFLW